MNRIVIIHGTKGSPQGNWFPWLSAELSKTGAEVLVPHMPTPDGQSLENWLETFEEEVGAVDSSTIVIGHSVGAVFLLRLLERATCPLHAAIFVAGFTGALGLPEYDALNASFVKGALRWDKIKAHAKHLLCFSGDNDPYVPLEQGLQIARELRVEPIIVPGGGHLNAEFGYTAFPALLEKVKEILRG